MKSITILLVILFNLYFILTKSNSYKKDKKKDTRKRYTGCKETDKVDEYFSEWKAFYNKTYSKDSKEGKEKFKNFQENMKFVLNCNSKKGKYSLELNSRADEQLGQKREIKFDIESIEKNYVPPPVIVEQPQQEGLRFLQEDPSYFSIYWGSLFGEPVNQGLCGSCYAIATVGVIESQYKRYFNQTISLSAQQLVDCDTTNLGCKGGSPKNSLTTIQKSGISFESDYPLTQQQGACNIKPQKNFMIEAIDTCLGGCTKEKVIQLLEDGPLISVIDGYTPEFDLYSSGILNYTCLQKNHAVILIGYVKNITDEYFIIRNSYGSNWGENGEANIQVKSSDLSCFIETYAFQPKLIPIQPNPPPKCIKLFQNCSYQGTFLEICNNTQNITIPVNSFTNPTYEATTYFTKPNCDGVSYTFNTENICLSNSIYKTLSSNIRSIVFPNQDLPKLKCIKVYEQTCVSGNVFEICADSPDLGSMQISSIRVLKQTGSYVTVTAYTGTNYTGISTTITSNRYILSSTFDKKIKSLKFNW